MKKSLSILFILILFSTAVKAQLEKVIVETYYVSDTLDATDTTDGRTLDAGSKTYRVYVDLKPGCKLVAVYGNGSYPLKISSTANFFNNIDRPTEYYGYLIKKNYFGSNPTLALDSWLTLGLATTVHNGVLKTEDTDGSVVGGTHNGGGSSSISGGILKNNDPAAGIPLTTEDGLMTNTYTYTSQFIDQGFDSSSVDTTVFGTVKIGSSFTSYNASLRQIQGVVGAIPDSNQILIAQLTTKGTLTFSFNITILDSSGHEINYVAPGSSTTFKGDTLLNPYLSYPLACGCRDTKYLEYNPNASCDDSAACHTLKVYGCTDTMACNFDPNANVFLPNFCCYPGYCNDRNVALVCPNLTANKLKQDINVDVYPNPVQNYLMLQLISSIDSAQVNYVIYDAYNNIVMQKDLGTVSGNTTLQIDVANLPDGLYLFKASVSGVTSIKKFFKN